MEQKEKKILVPVDFSDKSKEGIYQAIQIAKVTGSKICLLHVIRTNLPPWNFMDEKEFANQIVTIEQALINEAEKLVESNPPIFSAFVKKGKLCDTILEEAKNLQVEMIVMGTSTADNIKKKIIGSNALRVATEAEIPVITVKNGCASKSLKTIILPLDLTKETKEKVTNAIQLAKIFESKIIAVSFSSTNDDRVVSHLKNQLKQVKDFVSNSGIEIETNFEMYNSGSREEALVKFIQKKDGDIVMITTNQQPEIIRFFLGSFAKEVMHSAPVPVVSIVPKGTFKVLLTLPGTE
jgi:nucleotide-binding universal stress UspA family protein